MTVFAAPKLTGYATLAALGLAVALVLGQPAAALVALPFAAALLVGLAFASRPAVRWQASLDRERVLEGELVTLQLRLETSIAIEVAEARLAVPRLLEIPGGGGAYRLRLEPRSPRTVTLALRPRRFGGYRLRTARLQVRDPFGFLEMVQDLDLDCQLRVFPGEEALDRVLRPLRTQAFTGDELSPRTGDGIEFADVRPFATGDRPRRVNWRVSSRRQELYVNEFHLERNADVVLFLDSFDALGMDETGTLALEVRAATTLADHHLRRRDRVGMVGFGGTLRWLVPASGGLQWYRLVETLLDTTVNVSYAWKDVDVIPPRTLPAQAMVVALSPLLDERAVRALFDLRGRGYDLAVVEIATDPFLPRPQRQSQELAQRLWRLERSRVRAGLRRVGAAVEVWDPRAPLAVVLERLEDYRRSARTVLAR